MPEMMSHDRGALDALFDATIVGHVAFVDEDGGPAVLPTAVVRWGDRLVVHGSTGSRWMRLAAGSPAVVSITAVDGIIVARSAFESSVSYRSAVVFGSFETLKSALRRRRSSRPPWSWRCPSRSGHFGCQTAGPRMMTAMSPVPRGPAGWHSASVPS